MKISILKDGSAKVLVQFCIASVLIFAVSVMLVQALKKPEPISGSHKYVAKAPTHHTR